MSRALPAWTSDLVPVDMDGAARLLGISRRFLVDVIQTHKHYEPRGNRKVFYPEHIRKLSYVISPPAISTPLDAVRNLAAAKIAGSSLADLEAFMAGPFVGQVYFIRCNDRVKIGFTTNWEKRLGSLKTACPHPITIISVFPGGRVMERFLHTAFATLRSHGEWFEEKGDLAQLISTIEALE